MFSYTWNQNFYKLLGLFFILLKLMGLFPWAWWWVLTPLFLDVVLEVAEHITQSKSIKKEAA